MVGTTLGSIAVPGIICRGAALHGLGDGEASMPVSTPPGITAAGMARHGAGDMDIIKEFTDTIPIIAITIITATDIIHVIRDIHTPAEEVRHHTTAAVIGFHQVAGARYLLLRDAHRL
jgi:hypothetical protein